MNKRYCIGIDRGKYNIIDRKTKKVITTYTNFRKAENKLIELRIKERYDTADPSRPTPKLKNN